MNIFPKSWTKEVKHIDRMVVKELSFKAAAVRAIEWRAVSVVIDFTVTYVITRRLVLSLGITSISNFARTIAHTFWIKKRGHD